MTKHNFISALAANNLEQYLPRFEALAKDSTRYYLQQGTDNKGAVPGQSGIGAMLRRKGIFSGYYILMWTAKCWQGPLPIREKCRKRHNTGPGEKEF
jgi:hypothetical protein